MKKNLIFALFLLIGSLCLLSNNEEKSFKTILNNEKIVVLNNVQTQNYLRHISYSYQNHCWRCGAPINSDYNVRCKTCGWYICNNCGACAYDCPRMEHYDEVNQNNNNSSKKKDNTGNILGGVIVALLIVGGIYSYYKKA